MAQISITKGGRIKIPTSLYNQYLEEYEEANKILRQRQKAKGRKLAIDGLSFRKSDLSKFERKSDLIRYIQTTHKVVTGKYFDEQLSLYRRNLLTALLTNNGYTVTVTPTAFTLKQYNLETSNRKLYYLTTVIATLTKEQIETLERNSKVNLIGYQYQPENTAGEHIDYLIDLLNTPKSRGGVFEEKNYYDNTLVPYMQRRLDKKLEGK